MAEKTVHEKETVRTESTAKIPKPRAGWVPLLLGLIVVGAVAGGIIYWIQKDKDKKDDQANISEIRDAFPDLRQSNNSNNQANNGGFFYNSTSTPTATPTPTPSPTPTPTRTLSHTPTPTPTIAPSVYRSSQGFEFTMPGAWATDPAQNSGGKELFFSRSTGQLIGSSEVYSNTSGETLDSLEKILKGSPEVSDIYRTTVGSTPAVGYSANGSKHAALISGSRIYYFHGQLASQSITFTN